MRVITVAVLKVNKEDQEDLPKFETVEIGADLEEYHKLIGCRTISMVKLSEEVEAIIDDEGLYSNEYAYQFEIDGVTSDYFLAGTVILCSIDSGGHTISLQGRHEIAVKARIPAKILLGHGFDFIELDSEG